MQAWRGQGLPACHQNEALGPGPPRRAQATQGIAGAAAPAGAPPGGRKRQAASRGTRISACEGDGRSGQRAAGPHRCIGGWRGPGAQEAQEATAALLAACCPHNGLSVGQPAGLGPVQRSGAAGGLERAGRPLQLPEGLHCGCRWRANPLVRMWGP